MIADGVAAGTRVGPLRSFPGHPGQFRAAHGAGWALVGDAGYFKDPITAHGISDALRDAELLADAAAVGTDAALARYQAERDQLSSGMFELTESGLIYEWRDYYDNDYWNNTGGPSLIPE